MEAMPPQTDVGAPDAGSGRLRVSFTLRHWPAALVGLALTGAAFLQAHDPLSSMASYTGALMVLNQIAPPMLLLSLPSTLQVRIQNCRQRRFLLGAMLSPFAASILFVIVSVAISLPGVLNPGLVNALYTLPIAGLELASGLMFWGQLLPVTRVIERPWQVGVLALVVSLPMGAVAVVWLVAPNVLYSPYIDVICRWNIPPILDQKWAGFVMLCAGIPMQLYGIWVLLGIGTTANRK